MPEGAPGPDGASVPEGASSTRRGMLGVAAATVFAAGSGYLVMLAAGRELGAAGFAVFTVFWSLFFTVVGVFNGLMQETTRGVRAAPRTPAQRRGASPLRVAGVLGGIVAVGVLASSPLYAERLLPGHALLGALLLAAALGVVAGQATLWGALAGTGRWGVYAVALTLDAGARLAVAIATIALGWGVVGFAVATVAGAGTWLAVVAASPGARASLTAPVDVPTRAFVSHTLHAMAASAATSVLIVGFPTLLRATGGTGAAAGSLLFAVTITRAPLLVPLTSFQSAIIVYFVDRRSLRALALPVAAVTGVGAVGAALAAWLGPPIIRFIGDGFDVSGPVMAALTVGAAATAVLMLTGSAAMAFDLHRGYAVGWWVATGVVAAVLLAPLPLETATCLALIAGPCVGAAVHLAVIRAAPRKDPAS